MYAPEMRIYDCWGNWEVKDLSLWKNNVAEWFNGLNEEGVLLKVDFHDLVLEEDISLAFVYCTVTFTARLAEGGEQQ